MKFGSTILRLQDFFKVNSVVRNSQRLTRNGSTSCDVISHNTVLFEKLVKCFSIKLWNSLPVHIKNFETSNVSVREEIREWLLNSREDAFVQ